MDAHVTDHGKDLMYALSTVTHVIEQAQAGLLGNVTLPNAQFVAVGFNAEDGSVPVLAHNTVTDEWIWARALFWCEAREDRNGYRPAGFVWSQGHYTDKEDARENFQKEIRTGGLIWYDPQEYD